MATSRGLNPHADVSAEVGDRRRTLRQIQYTHRVATAVDHQCKAPIGRNRHTDGVIPHAHGIGLNGDRRPFNLQYTHRGVVLIGHQGQGFDRSATCACFPRCTACTCMRYSGTPADVYPQRPARRLQSQSNHGPILHTLGAIPTVTVLV